MMLVLIPQQVEAAPLLDTISGAGHTVEKFNVGRIEAAFVEGLGLWLAVAGHGKTELALRAQHLLENMPAPSVVVCAGAAGGLDPEVARTDVVIGTCSIEHDYKLRFRKAALPNLPADGRIVDEIRDSFPVAGPGFRVHFGPIASGDEDIVDQDRARELRGETSALCVAWEGAGAARVARFNGIPFVEMRAVTDAADATASSDFRASVTTAMANLAAVIIHWARFRKVSS